MKRNGFRSPRFAALWTRLWSMEQPAVVEDAAAPSAPPAADGGPWRAELQAAADLLAGLTTGTEQEFLQMGERLQDFYHRAREIETVGAAAAGLLSGERMEEAIARLGTLADEMGGGLQESQRNVAGSLAGIQDIHALLERTRKEFLDFERDVRTLRVLAVSTRIESAWLAGAGQGFVTLTHQVMGNAESIGVKVETCLAELEALSRGIGTVLIALRELEARRSGETRTIVNGIGSSLRVLQAKQCESAASAQGILRRSEQIAAAMGEVVSSIQFHDITRQQMEHVQEALVALQEEQRPEVVPIVCTLQANQLQHGRDTVGRAISRIVSSLRQLAANGATIAEETATLVGATGRTGAGFADELQGHFDSAVAAFRNVAQQTGEMERQVIALTQALAAMSVFSSEVEGISHTIKLIALNTALKAAKRGRSGAPISELALGIQEVFRSAKERSAVISAGFERILQETQELGAKTAAFRKSETGTVARAEAELEGLLGEVNGTHAEAVGLLGQVDGLGRGLAADIEHTVGRIHVHEVIAGQVEQVLARIQGALALLPAPDPTAGETPEAELLESLAEQYTMAREREIHEGWLSREPGTNAAAESERPSETQPAGSDLGDNVELF